MTCAVNMFVKNHNNMLLWACFLYCLSNLNVSATLKYQFRTHNNTNTAKKMLKMDYDDITTLYSITNTYSVDSNGFIDKTGLTHYNGSYSIKIHSTTNSTGSPLQNSSFKMSNSNHMLFNVFKNGSIQNYNYTDIKYITKYKKHKIHTFNGDNCTSDMYDAEQLSRQKTDIYSQKCYLVLYYRYSKHDDSNIYSDNSGTYKRIFLDLKWIADKNQTGLTITYIHRLVSTMNISVEIFNEKALPLIIVDLEKGENIKTLRITNMDLKENKKYQLKIILKIRNDVNSKMISEETLFGLIRIAKYSNQDRKISHSKDHYYDYNDNYLIAIHYLNLLKLLIDSYDENEIDDVRLMEKSDGNINSKPFRIFGYDNIKHLKKDNGTPNNSTKPCLNGGLETTDSKCFCPPGFKGEFCETGCGPNLYGSNCTGVCSVYKSKQCRGILMCTNYGCTCSVGLTGRMCNEDCKLGKYGANCERNCSTNNCYKDMCDQYTGICSEGCSKEYIAPKCQEKYPYLIKPPTKISEEYETIKLQLDFQSDNIRGGNKNIKINYYQLLYKSSNENTFSKSELKEINENTTGVTEVLSDLIPDTSYTIGVLILTNDVNYNYPDVVYGHYRTSCKQPQINDYNIKFIPGIYRVNITWNKIITERSECKVREYVLTLTLKQSQNEMSSVQEIISSTDSGHVIDYLYPGNQYNISMTPKTSNGYLQSSSIYSFNPSISDDVDIKDITAISKNNKIHVSWKLEYASPNVTSDTNPVTCVIKYKLNRIYSCSLDDIEDSKWTSIDIYNKTNYEIFDTVPNSQYCIQIAVSDNDKNAIQQNNIVYLYTKPSYPQTEPKLDGPIRVTNNSVYVQWDRASINCTKLNGFFSNNFYIELKDKATNTIRKKETNQYNIYFDYLNQSTSYEIKVFIKTNVGYSPEHFLSANFTNLKSIYELMVYKKNIKHRTIGLRWKYSGNTTLNEFLVLFNDKLTDVYSINSAKCSAWPEYYCHTFNNLNIRKNENYTFSLSPVIPLYPGGRFELSISFKANEGPPDPPTDVKALVVANDTVTLQWGIPWILNSELVKFIIVLEDYPDPAINTFDNKDAYNEQQYELNVNEEVPTYNYTINQLKPNTNYTFGVIANCKYITPSNRADIFVTTLPTTMTPEKK